MQAVDLSQEDIHTYLARHQKKELLRFLTCGSVDDGKSTLIGRLLHDTKMIYEDQLAAVKRDSEKVGTTGAGEIDLALLTDGLKAEREQGITIDVAYRYFSTDRRKFIIADTPGHEQYTRNMATGASTCQLAIILIDARHGVMTADPPALVHRVAPGHPARRRRHQQDGPRRLLAGRLRADQGRLHRLRRQARPARHHLHPDVGAEGRQRRRPRATRCRGTPARRCWTTWRRSTSPATAT